MINLAGRVAVVTGAGAGIGRAHALLLSSLGASLVINDLGASDTGHGASGGPAATVVAEIEASGGKAVANTDDISIPAGSERMIQSAIDAFGRIDILVNNAGIMIDGSAPETSLDDIQRLMAVTLMGPIYSARAAQPFMIKQGFGRIIFTSSTSGLLGRERHTIYSAAKTGLLGLMNCMAQDCAGTGVLVNMVVPGAATRLSVGRMWKEIEQYMGPEHISPIVAWLASENCTVSGEIYNAIGGHFARAVLMQNEGVQFDPRNPVTTAMVEGAIDKIRDVSQPIPYRGTMRSLKPNLERMGLIPKGL